MNATAEKFGYPETLLARFDHWLVLLRPAQPTLGSLVLVCTDPASRFGEISPEAATELQRATARIESVLGATLRNDKINYLMLMMVDPDVHFHVLPRYETARELEGARFEDPFWPGPPDVTSRLDLDEARMAALQARLREGFAAAG
jgi:diadenosine tetraphosphate (Ap4A) HIT family hydrolase